MGLIGGNVVSYKVKTCIYHVTWSMPSEVFTQKQCCSQPQMMFVPTDTWQCPQTFHLSKLGESMGIYK